MKIINSYTSWQPLEEVIVGRAYTPDYFDFIENAQVRNQLQQILSETEEDLTNLQKTIETYGARVRRPELSNKHQFQQSQYMAVVRHYLHSHQETGRSHWATNCYVCWPCRNLMNCVQSTKQNNLVV